MDAFSGYHPFVNLIYFLIVIGCTMFYMHPVFLGLSLVGSLLYSVYLKGIPVRDAALLSVNGGDQPAV